MNPLRMVAVVLGAIVLQVCLVSQFSIGGARPDLVLLVVLAAAFVLGPDEGAVVGFGAGLVFDAFLSTPFGFHAFTLTLIAYAVGSWTAGVVRSAWWLSALAIAGASAAALLAQGVLGELLGQGTLVDLPLATALVVVAGVNLILAPIATRLVQWARAGDRPRRRSIFAS